MPESSAESAAHATTSAPGSIIITIDGPAGTGKSSVAHQLSKRLGLEFLDTGAMYRAASLITLEHELEPEDGPALAEALEHADLHFDWESDPPRLLLGQRDISDRIRDLDVSGRVSIIAACPQVRRVLVELQRKIARAHPRLVSEGRDQGSVVFPEAEVRFFLTAEVGIRAERRKAQLLAAGKTVEDEQIIRDIEQRDRLDASRRDGPLINPPGAVEVDTTHRNLEEVVSELERVVREQIPAGSLASS